MQYFRTGYIVHFQMSGENLARQLTHLGGKRVNSTDRYSMRDLHTVQIHKSKAATTIIKQLIEEYNCEGKEFSMVYITMTLSEPLKARTSVNGTVNIPYPYCTELTHLANVLSSSLSKICITKKLNSRVIAMFMPSTSKEACSSFLERILELLDLDYWLGDKAKHNVGVATLEVSGSHASLFSSANILLQQAMFANKYADLSNESKFIHYDGIHEVNVSKIVDLLCTIEERRHYLSYSD